MIFYKHYIGDFQRDTGHLSLTERGAYLSLIHHYYATEKPLPNDHASLCRITGAFSKSERDALKSVIRFFEVKDGCLWHKRIEAELEKQEGRCDTNRRIALEREERKRAEKCIENEHENSTKRAANVAPNEHENSTNQNQNQEEEEKPNGFVSRTSLPTCPAQKIIDLYHEVLPEMPVIRVETDSRKKALPKFWKFVLTSKRSDGTQRASNSQEALDWIRGYFERARYNDFLMGRGPKAAGHEGWACNLDFLLTEKGRVHVIEKTKDAQ